jgi:hypothetical protein
MKTIIAVLFLCCSTTLFAQAPLPFVPDGNTMGLWHFDETSGSMLQDASFYQNNGQTFGTSIVTGRFGNARLFNGVSGYAYVPDPSNGTLDFGVNQSLTLEAWFKTTSLANQRILRKGLAPVPGYELGMNNGKVFGIVGNREDGTPPDTLLVIKSETSFNDNVWHHAVFIRDRVARKLFLYVDGFSVAEPVTDNFPYALANDLPLGIGCWYPSPLPLLFQGAIDEARISNIARHPVASIDVSPALLAFGSVVVGTNTPRDLAITNFGSRDTLRVTNISSNNSVFTTNATSFVLLPGASRSIQVLYAPTVVRSDTGSLSIASNDPNRPIVRVRLSGQGFAPAAAPFITSIRDIPEDQGKQVRVIWYQSVHDSLGDSLRIANYSVWRRVGTNNALWDYIATIPAVRFAQYAYVAPTLFDSTRATGIRWSVFRVSAHTSGGAQVFFSAPDSGYSVDNIAPFPPLNLAASVAPGRITLTWSEPVDPDFHRFMIYRSTVANFIPSESNRIGTSSINRFLDQNISGSSAFYYRVSATDTAGNESPYSDQLRVVLTGVGPGTTLPTEYAMHQNYPNPFNPTTTIRFDVPKESFVRFTIFDMLGREVATLVDEVKQPGNYEVFVQGEGLSSGTYFYRMNAGDFVSTRRMILMK